MAFRIVYYKDYLNRLRKAVENGLLDPEDTRDCHTFCGKRVWTKVIYLYDILPDLSDAMKREIYDVIAYWITV